MLRIGFTGSQKGLTTHQSIMLESELLKLIPDHGSVEFHHGDCIGADFQAHAIFHDIMFGRSNGYIVIHPPDNPAKRAYSDRAHGGRYNKITTNVLDEQPYHVRNQDIVDWSDIMIACPAQSIEQLRSGTWSVVRKARKQAKQVTVITP